MQQPNRLHKYEPWRDPNSVPHVEIIDIVKRYDDHLAVDHISLDIYKNGGYVTSVCHGIAGLLNIKDDDGKYLISGKNITGFTTQEEFLSGKRKVVPFLNENAAKALGANFKKVRAFKPYAVQDGQLITGQNPWSPKEVARLLLQNIGEN